MRQYIYPQNLKAQPKLWLWKLRDIAILGIALLISIFAVATIKLVLPLALTLVYAFLTIGLGFKNNHHYCVCGNQNRQQSDR